MSDFSELCPLFNTGVFAEVTFPQLKMTMSSNTCNALEGLITAGAHSGNFTFGRTVMVTGAFIRKWTINAELATMHLDHRATSGATLTTFATATISITVSNVETKHTWMPFTISASQTFTSNEVLGFSNGAGTASSGGEYDLIVRYREK